MTTLDPSAVARIRPAAARAASALGRWVAATAILALLALLMRAFAQGQIKWAVVGQFLTAKSILTGLGFTLIMTVLAMTLGIGSGVLFAVMKMSPNPVLRAWPSSTSGSSAARR